MHSEIAIYIHWPFCKSLCPYCDFNSHIITDIDYKSWLDAYKKEIDYFSEHIKNKKLVSIFFGGGTPSLMHPDLVANIIDHIKNLFSFDQDIEITLEANPTSYECKKFESFKDSGVNRVSLGIQSLDDEELKFLGRTHSSKEAIKVIESVKTIFENYSLDFIYGLPSQTLNEFKDRLKKIINLVGNHVSLYQLTIEKGTPFFKLHKDGKIKLPEDNILVDLYKYTAEYLASYNLNRYEISNFALPNYESKHNMCYWNYQEYLGIGPGAHSRLHNYSGIGEFDGISENQKATKYTRVSALMNFANPQKWHQNVIERGNAIQKHEILSHSQLIDEILVMSSRLSKGIDCKYFYNMTGVKIDDILDNRKLSIFIENELVKYDGSYISCTDKGMILQNYIISQLVNFDSNKL